jgi:hypothetical protein
MASFTEDHFPHFSWNYRIKNRNSTPVGAKRTVLEMNQEVLRLFYCFETRKVFTDHFSVWRNNLELLANKKEVSSVPGTCLLLRIYLCLFHVNTRCVIPYWCGS